MTEKEVLVVIDKIARRLANKFKFGYHSTEDMQQQARLFAWRGLEKYDGIRDLENFLWVVVHNQLYNFKRDNFERPDNPCIKCKNYISYSCTINDNILDCKSYYLWVKRNTAKKNLMLPIELNDVNDSAEDNMSISDNVHRNSENSELFNLLDKELPANLRKDFLCIKYGGKLTKQKRLIVQEAIQEILDRHNYNYEH